MQVWEFNGKNYEVDADEFLLDAFHWDTGFAEGMAQRNGIEEGLSAFHWRVLKFIREHFLKQGACPAAYEICRECHLSSAELNKLFPMDNNRCAYKIAGIPYYSQFPSYVKCGGPRNAIQDRVYKVDIAGFLIDPDEWDCDFAIFRMRNMNIPEVSDLHLEIIQYLRKRYYATGQIPTVEQTCADHDIDLEDLQVLFPGDCYRLAVRTAGLRPPVRNG
ncbi:MAG: TusE/DsrC/DsvC family sulfur relay protein [Syntrophobacteraceae bacterium]|nr:TusE/DsrC/DsvC family sulfur relay protein [Syntrophobacteraceae bacterium]